MNVLEYLGSPGVPWTLAALVIISLSCALVGVWLVVQRQSMVSDGISHGVLPGLVLVYLLAGTRAPLPMVLGAAVAGLFTVWLTHALSQLRFVKSDAALGATFSVLFAAGTWMITRFAGQVDLDPGCVLYGLAEFLPLDTQTVMGQEVPRALLTVLPSVALAGAYLVTFRKEILLTSFDPRFAASLGFKPGWVQMGLMAALSLVCVAGFEAVGSVLIVGMVVIPGACARLMVDRLRPMGWISVGIAALAAVAGYALALWVNTSVAGMIALVLGATYAGVATFSVIRQSQQRRNATLAA